MLDALLKTRQFLLYVTAVSIEVALTVGQCLELFLREAAVQLASNGIGITEHGQLHVLLDRDICENAANAVVDLFALQLLADPLQLVEQRLDYSTLASGWR